MKCTISATEPSILRDAKPGDLFIARTSGENECVCTLTHPQLMVSDSIIRRAVVLACRVDKGEPGYHQPGELMLFPDDMAIQFVEQTQEAKFSEGARNFDVKVRLNIVFGDVVRGHDSLRDAGEFTEPAKPGDQL